MRYLIIVVIVISIFSVQQNSYAALQISIAQRATLDQLFLDEPLHAKWTNLLKQLPKSEQADLEIIRAQIEFKAGASRIKQAISSIESAHVQQLESNYTALQHKYTPLFTHYKSLNVQLTSLPAKSASELRKAIRFQLNALRPAVLIARTALSVSRTRLQAARKLKNKKVMEARTKWRILQSHTRSFAVTKARIKLQESHLRTEWKSLLKQKDRPTAAVSLKICESYAQTLTTMKQNYLNRLLELNRNVNQLAKQL